MDTSDDPVTMTVLGTAGAFAAAKAISTGKKFEAPSMQAEQAKKTAEPVEQLSETARKNRQRKASMITKDWDTPKLGYAGLLG